MRTVDDKIEATIHDFVFQYGWKRIFARCRSTPEEKYQFQGVDLVAVDASGVPYAIDEKAKFKPYKGKPTINHDCPSIAFELSRLCRDGVRRDGWMLDTTQKTTHYAILSPYIYDGETEDRITPDNIRAVTLLLVSKKDLISYVSSFGESLRDMDAKMRHSSSTVIHPEHKQYVYTRSPWLAEEPICIALYRQRLLNLPHTRQWTIDRTGIAEKR